MRRQIAAAPTLFKRDSFTIYWLAVTVNGPRLLRRHARSRRLLAPRGMVMGSDANKIPAEIALELRSLAHDLSNSLESIVQAAYLVSQSDLPQESRRWVEILDQATQEALRHNRKLREILRSKS